MYVVYRNCFFYIFCRFFVYTYSKNLLFQKKKNTKKGTRLSF